MRPFAVVEPYPVIDDPLGLEAVIDFVQIDCLLLQGSPEPLDEDVDPLPSSRNAVSMRGEIAAPPIHGYFDLGLDQRRDPACPRIWAALIRIHDLGFAIFGDGFVQCFNAKAGIQRI